MREKKTRFEMNYAYHLGEGGLLIHPKNRPIMDGSKFKQLRKNIEEKGYVICPVVVNKDLEIIDGQHRAQALEDLGWEIPYVVNHSSGGVKDIQDAQNFSNKWKPINYIQLHAKSKIEDFVMLKFLCEKYQKEFSVPKICFIYADSDNFTRTPGHVRAGTYKINKQEGDSVMNILYKFRDGCDENKYLKLYKDSQFCRAIKLLVRRNKNFDVKRLIISFNQHTRKFIISTDAIENCSAICRIYNKALIEKNKIH